jgi:uncharacterized repeat protein (TIGR04052 family)
MSKALSLLAIAGGVWLSGCGKPPVATQPVTIHFAAMVGTQTFSCGTTYQGLGSTGTTWNPQDFRFYVSAVSVVDSSGTVVPLSLKEDGVWQHDNVALLDFENATSACSNGTPETNGVVTGTIPEGHTITGIQFTVGVPEDLNHLDIATAQSPLNVSGLYWSWAGGYMFLRVEGETTGQTDGWSMHLGSANCSVDPSGKTTTCQDPNRPVVTLTGFDPTKNTVIADAAQLFHSVNLDVENNPPGCLSEPTNGDCAMPFANLGLPFNGSSAPTQIFFRAQ